jgi:hypothetical protein
MQKKLTEIQKRRTQAQMDKVLRQRRERTRLKPQASSLSAASNHFFPYRLIVNTAYVRLGYVPVEVTESSADTFIVSFAQPKV